MHESWSIDIPGLTRERAAELKELLSAGSPFGVVATDPSIFMVRGNDRQTVELLIKCLELAEVTDDFSQAERLSAKSLLEDYEDWLGRSQDQSEQ